MEKLKLEYSEYKIEKLNAKNFSSQLIHKNFTLENNLKEMYNKNEEKQSEIYKVKLIKKIYFLISIIT